MNPSLPTQAAGLFGALAIGTFLLMQSAGAAASDCAFGAQDERVLIATQRVTSEVRSVAAARALLVQEHLRVFDGPSTMPPTDLDEEDFQSQRAELHAARLELARAEEDLDSAPCARQDPRAVADRAVGATSLVRIELPPTLLLPLQPVLVDQSRVALADPVSRQRLDDIVAVELNLDRSAVE